VSRAAGIAAVFAVAASSGLPVAWMVWASLRPEAALFDPEGAAGGFGFGHYAALFADRDFWRPLRNSIIVAGSTTSLCLLVGSGCAWALARLPLPGRRAILGGVLAVAMLPPISIVSPLYLALRRVGLIDTYPGLVLPYLSFALPLTVWFLVPYFRQLPAQVEEAAMIDGASRFRAFRTVTLPLAAPGLVTTAILTFVYCWNEFLFALAFTLGAERQTVPVAIALFRGQHRVPWGEVLAAAVVCTAPLAALVAALQKRVIRGLTVGSVEG
jgi:ABC-type glycerol-3-phosphate transport system permease component